MIKNICLIVILVSCGLFGYSQNQYADSLRSVLKTTTDPVDRFDLLNNILLDITSYRGSNIDSLTTMQMVQVAQKQNNDSLSAISYNWLASYFYQQKGDNATALEYYFKAIPLAETTNDKRRISSIYFDMALVYFEMLDYEMALEVTRKGGENLPDKAHPMYYFMLIQYQANLVQYFLIKNNPDSAFHYALESRETLAHFNKGSSYIFLDYTNFAAAHAILGNTLDADEYFKGALTLQDSIENITSQLYFFNVYIPFLLANGRYAEGVSESNKLLYMGFQADNNNLKLAGAAFLRQFYDALNQIDSAYYYSRLESTISSQIFSQENKNKVQSLVFNNQLRSLEEESKAVAYQNQLKQYSLIGGLCMTFLIVLILFYNNRQKQRGNKVLETTLANLKSTQSQLIHSEKMASLGELTAGIAHEIQNPLNFVNNFSDLNKELIDEQLEEIEKGDWEETKALALSIKENETKITFHGKRAEEIVKSMLQHSRNGSGEKELTDINALADEYLRLSYHGLRAKDKSFNADFRAELDPDLPKVKVIPQDIGRVILNLINNAFQAVKGVEKPEVVVTTKKIPLTPFEKGDSTKSPLEGGRSDVSARGVLITVSDNGSGIPDNIREKIFQPFFTTKPTGQGTGLGLSMSYDIVTKGHGGTISVESEEGKGTKFIILLPV
ncbi:MAG: signal transduction histidine kinase [Marinoscillum sp.]|jgi:signal transduction histidine kinase